MRLLLGIDESGSYEAALRLVQRIEFADAEWHLVQISQRGKNTEATGSHAGVETSAIMLVKDQLLKQGIAPILHQFEGSPASALLQLADDIRADLVVIGSKHRGRMLGSVGRALTVGAKGSFLVGRGSVAADGPVTAVFATDHSAYARRSLDLFAQMRPQGFRQVVVVNASDMLEMGEVSQYLELVDRAAKEGLTLEEHLEELGEEAVRHLSDVGIRAISEQRHGLVGNAIKAAMEEHRAELLILGAQGHGFWDRLFVGSVTLDQLTSSPYSLMVIRSRHANEVSK